MIDRAERRIKNLDFFKNVKITNEPGSAPDRVVINVDVEEQSTGDFSVMGGYSTADGFMAQVSISERNLLGTGRYAKASLTYGQYIRGVEFRFRRALFPRSPALASASICSREQTVASPYLSYGTETYRHQSETGRAAARRPFAADCAIRSTEQPDHAAVESERLQQHQPEFLDHLSDAERRQRRDGRRGSVQRIPAMADGYSRRRSLNNCLFSTQLASARRSTRPRCRCARNLPTAAI